MRAFAKRFVCFGLVLWFGLSGITAQAASAANGVWSLSTGDYLVVMQDSASGTSVALQVSPSLQSGKVWVGSGGSTALSLSTVDGTGSFSAQLDGASLSGSIVLNGASSSVTGTQVLAYAGGTYDGIWQKSDVNNAYLAYATVSSGGAAIGLALDVKINADYTVTYDVATGAVVSETFIGASLVTGNKLTMPFDVSVDPATVTGTYATTTRPPQTVSTFSATRIFKMS